MVVVVVVVVAVMYCCCLYTGTWCCRHFLGQCGSQWNGVAVGVGVVGTVVVVIDTVAHGGAETLLLPIAVSGNVIDVVMVVTAIACVLDSTAFGAA